MIRLTYLASDGYRKRKQFKLLRGARKYAQDMVGKHPEIAMGYAVSGDGVGTIREVSGCKIQDLFGDDPKEPE
jgi:hypothetical protein